MVTDSAVARIHASLTLLLRTVTEHIDLRLPYRLRDCWRHHTIVM